MLASVTGLLSSAVDYRLIWQVALLSQLLACASPEVTTAEWQNGESGPLVGIGAAALLDCAREQGLTLLQAHRAGGRPGVAENSLAAIEASLSDGALFLEIDVAQTVDGELVLMHDDTLDRTTTGEGDLATVTFSSLSTLRLVDQNGTTTDDKVPTLEEALSALSGRGFAQIDRKRSTSFEAIARVIDASAAAHRTVIITYSLADAIKVHQRLPKAVVSVSITRLEDINALELAGVDVGQLAVWLGLGDGSPTLDFALTAMGIETSYGDFRAEASGQIDYRRMAYRGAEVISVDDVPAAAAALNAPATARRAIAACRQRFDADGARVRNQ